MPWNVPPHGVPEGEKFTATLRRGPRAEAESGVCVVLLDPGLVVLGVNAGLLRLLERPASAVPGLRFDDLLDPSSRAEVLDVFRRLVERGPQHVEIRAVLGADPASPRRLTAVVVRRRGVAVGVVVLIGPGAPGDGAIGTFTEIDAKILEGIAAGTATTRLASKLYLSKQGVEYRVGALLRRFSVPNRAALVAKAYQGGVFSTGGWPPRVRMDHIRQRGSH